MLEMFGKSHPGSSHTQFTAIYLRYKKLKGGLESLDEMQYLRFNPAFRKVLLGKLPTRMKEKCLEWEARLKETGPGDLDRFEVLDDYMEYQFRISMSVESVEMESIGTKAKCFHCGSESHKKFDCPELKKTGKVVRSFNAASNVQQVLPCRCCGLNHVNPHNGKQFMRLSRCDKFRNMDIQNRMRELERLKACALCLDDTKDGQHYQNCSMIDNNGYK